MLSSAGNAAGSSSNNNNNTPRIEIGESSRSLLERSFTALDDDEDDNDEQEAQYAGGTNPGTQAALAKLEGRDNRFAWISFKNKTRNHPS